MDVVPGKVKSGSQPKTVHSARKRLRPKRRKREEPVLYEMRIAGWDYYYGFRVGDPKNRYDQGPYSELATLTFHGDLVAPEGIRYTKCSLTLSARAGLMDERFDPPPKSVGLLSAHEETLNAYVFVPVERMAELTTVAASGRLQMADFAGTRLRYRSGEVHRISFSTEIEEDEGKVSN